MKCCNEECTTPFCPTCGKQLQTHPLASLLVYLRLQQAAKVTRADGVRGANTDTDEKDGDKKERAAERVRKADAIALKWKQWADAVQEALATPAPPKT